jgi:hypothetical protein
MMRVMKKRYEQAKTAVAGAAAVVITVLTAAATRFGSFFSSLINRNNKVAPEPQSPIQSLVSPTEMTSPSS